MHRGRGGSVAKGGGRGGYVKVREGEASERELLVAKVVREVRKDPHELQSILKLLREKEEEEEARRRSLSHATLQRPRAPPSRRRSLQSTSRGGRVNKGNISKEGTRGPLQAKPSGTTHPHGDLSSVDKTEDYIKGGRALNTSQEGNGNLSPSEDAVIAIPPPLSAHINSFEDGGGTFEELEELVSKQEEVILMLEAENARLQEEIGSSKDMVAELASGTANRQDVELLEEVIKEKEKMIKGLERSRGVDVSRISQLMEKIEKVMSEDDKEIVKGHFTETMRITGEKLVETEIQLQQAKSKLAESEAMNCDLHVSLRERDAEMVLLEREIQHLKTLPDSVNGKKPNAKLREKFQKLVTEVSHLQKVNIQYEKTLNTANTSHELIVSELEDVILDLTKEKETIQERQINVKNQLPPHVDQGHNMMVEMTSTHALSRDLTSELDISSTARHSEKREMSPLNADYDIMKLELGNLKEFVLVSERKLTAAQHIYNESLEEYRNHIHKLEIEKEELRQKWLKAVEKLNKQQHKDKPHPLSKKEAATIVSSRKGTITLKDTNNPKHEHMNTAHEAPVPNFNASPSERPDDSIAPGSVTTSRPHSNLTDLLHAGVNVAQSSIGLICDTVTAVRRGSLAAVAAVEDGNSKDEGVHSVHVKTSDKTTVISNSKTDKEQIENSNVIKYDEVGHKVTRNPEHILGKEGNVERAAYTSLPRHATANKIKAFTASPSEIVKRDKFLQATDTSLAARSVESTRFDRQKLTSHGAVAFTKGNHATSFISRQRVSNSPSLASTFVPHPYPTYEKHVPKPIFISKLVEFLQSSLGYSKAARVMFFIFLLPLLLIFKVIFFINWIPRYILFRNSTFYKETVAAKNRYVAYILGMGHDSLAIYVLPWFHYLDVVSFVIDGYCMERFNVPEAASIASNFRDARTCGFLEEKFEQVVLVGGSGLDCCFHRFQSYSSTTSFFEIDTLAAHQHKLACLPPMLVNRDVKFIVSRSDENEQWIENLDLIRGGFDRAKRTLVIVCGSLSLSQSQFRECLASMRHCGAGSRIIFEYLEDNKPRTGTWKSSLINVLLHYTVTAPSLTLSSAELQVMLAESHMTLDEKREVLDDLYEGVDQEVVSKSKKEKKNVLQHYIVSAALKVHTN